uniref:glutathione transferase n=1 Tax=Leersia perrieri TaxID=77586 RepID=A0A0D9XLT1_9ORYZ
MAGSGDLKLLGVWTSPFVIRVRVVLNLKSIPYEYIEENLGDKSDLLLTSNPVHKSVPVLLHDGRPVNESQIIIQYIDELWPDRQSVLPSDPYDRAVARFWAAYVDDKVRPAWLAIVFGSKTEEEREVAVAKAVEALETLEGAFEGKKKPFFGGERIGFVDVVLGGYLGWFTAIDKMIGRRLIDPERMPALAAWEENFRAADAAKGVVPDDADKVLEFREKLLSWSAKKAEAKTRSEMAGGGELKLLGVWTSPFVLRVRFVLNLKSLTYEYIEESLGDKSDLLLTSNPVNKSVPVLLHDGCPVNESQIIIQYIDEVWPDRQSVLPSDPYDRAVARFWAAYIDDKLELAWLGILFRSKTEEEREVAVAHAVAALETLEGAFVECSKGKKPFFGGERIEFVDVVLGGYLGWFTAIERLIGRRLIDPARTPALAAWEDRFRATDVAKSVVSDDADKMLEFRRILLDWSASGIITL